MITVERLHALPLARAHLRHVMCTFTAGAFRRGALRRYICRPALESPSLLRWGVPLDGHKDDAAPPRAAMHVAWQTCRHLRTSSAQQAPSAKDRPDTQSPFQADEASAENCDRIVEEIRYRNIRIPDQLDISITRRIQVTVMGLVRGVVGAGKATVNFILSIPSRLVAASKMSLTEWKEAVSGMWSTVKHEAKHYWV